ncbi:ParB-like protein [Accumulibacter sp.]|uniref:ParB-like protein n=1 Tax=Accumulibacter sp. TaxID=2053492 RepID=UPI0026183DEF|nr:ParB-like protein [Accumulibacter sp.]
MDFNYDDCTSRAQRGGRLYQLRVADLHPTQCGVGLDEVNAKADSMRKKSKEELTAYLITHPVPIVIGNGDKFYLTDHHHLARALWEVASGKNEAGIDESNARVAVEVLYNWSVLKDYSFWKAMHDNSWVYLFDHMGGGPLPPDALPKHIKDLRNDPYRGLAWYVRTAFGYDKMPADFAEFQWAQFFRMRMILDNRLLRNQIEDTDILLAKMSDEDRQAIIDEAVHLASSSAAAGLPGYVGRGG